MPGAASRRPARPVAPHQPDAGRAPYQPLRTSRPLNRAKPPSSTRSQSFRANTQRAEGSVPLGVLVTPPNARVQLRNGPDGAVDATLRAGPFRLLQRFVRPLPGFDDGSPTAVAAGAAQARWRGEQAGRHAQGTAPVPARVASRAPPADNPRFTCVAHHHDARRRQPAARAGSPARHLMLGAPGVRRRQPVRRHRGGARAIPDAGHSQAESVLAQVNDPPRQRRRAARAAQGKRTIGRFPARPAA